jgi:hypothetical protein
MTCKTLSASGPEKPADSLGGGFRPGWAVAFNRNVRLISTTFIGGFQAGW